MQQNEMRQLARAEAVILRFGFKSRKHLDVNVARGNFPRPIKTGLRSVAWLESELAEWVQQRVAKRDAT